MLKINSEKVSPPEGSSIKQKAAVNYGKQLSVQELFDGRYINVIYISVGSKFMGYVCSTKAYFNQLQIQDGHLSF